VVEVEVEGEVAARDQRRAALGARAGPSASWEYEGHDEPLPRVGQLSILLDGGGEPRCVIETTGVEVVPMDAVDADLAHAEGEGDRPLATWRRDHERCFRRTLPRLGCTFDPSMPLVLERFVVRRPGSAA
jgi:uncharacterized protein YhfF